MRTASLTTLDNQRLRLEKEIIKAKQRIVLISEGEYPDVGSINQLRESIERNMQLITMIDQHRPAKVSGFSAKVL